MSLFQHGIFVFPLVVAPVVVCPRPLG